MYKFVVLLAAFVSLATVLSVSASLPKPAPNAMLGPEFGPTSGEGSFKVGDDPHLKIVKAYIVFSSHDRVRISLTADDKTELVLEGQGDHGGHLHRTVTLSSGLGKDWISGTGEINYVDYSERIADLTFQGTVDGKHFSTKFRGSGRHPREDRGDPDNDDRFSFADNVHGGGRLDIGDSKMRVTILHVNMSRNGDLKIGAESPDRTDIEWVGRWSGDGPTYKVTLRSTNRFQADIQGTLTLSRNHRAFKKIELEGTLDREPMRLYFAPQ